MRQMRWVDLMNTTPGANSEVARRQAGSSLGYKEGRAVPSVLVMLFNDSAQIISGKRFDDVVSGTSVLGQCEIEYSVL